MIYSQFSNALGRFKYRLMSLSASMVVESGESFSNCEVFFYKTVLFSDGDLLINTTCFVAFVMRICSSK